MWPCPLQQLTASALPASEESSFPAGASEQGRLDQYKARMEFGGWEENRRSNLDWLAKAGDLTDVTILVEAATFPAHRVVLAAHSDYFYRMFTCGMTESRNEDIKIQGIEPEVFQQVRPASGCMGNDCRC